MDESDNRKEKIGHAHPIEKRAADEAGSKKTEEDGKEEYRHGTEFDDGVKEKEILLGENTESNGNRKKYKQMVPHFHWSGPFPAGLFLFSSLYAPVSGIIPKIFLLYINGPACGGEQKSMGDVSSLLKKLQGARILGINPPVFDFTFFDLWAKPLGLLFLLDFLRRRGNTVSLIDCIAEGAEESLSWGRNRIRKKEIQKPVPLRNIPRRYHHFGLGEEEFLDRLRGQETLDYILVTSGMTYWYEGVFWAIRLLRQVFPSVPVILGGIYARLCPDHALLSGADTLQTDPLVFEMISPALDLYSRPGYATLLSSTGCPLHCDYCASKKLFPVFRQRRLDDVMIDLRLQMKCGGIQNGAFYDDALLYRKKERFYPLCKMLKQEFPELTWHTPNGLSVREIDQECADVLMGTGFQTLRLSLESIDPSLLGRSSFKATAGEYLRAIECLKRAGFDNGRIETYILAGLPGQAVSSVAETIDFVHSAGGVPKLAEFSPVPGTSAFEEAARRLPELREEPLLANKTVYSSYISGTLSPEELQLLKDQTKIKNFQNHKI